MWPPCPASSSSAALQKRPVSHGGGLDETPSVTLAVTEPRHIPSYSACAFACCINLDPDKQPSCSVESRSWIYARPEQPSTRLFYKFRPKMRFQLIVAKLDCSFFSPSSQFILLDSNQIHPVSCFSSLFGKVHTVH